MFIAALFTIAKIWKQVSTDEWMYKKKCIHTMKYYSVIKKERNLDIWDNMDGPWGHYAKQNMSDRERQIPYDLTYMWNLRKTETNK